MSLDLITDFPDRLSPMLVKELRQGLRAKTFVAVFLTLQIAMALILLSASAAASSANAGNVISAVIFIFFSIAVLLVQPLRGIGSISSEVKGNTIDMMVLTRLSASRIVHGKWFALVGQSALLLSTIVPYLILRYFFGGMNLVGEIVLLLLLFITSIALTAVTVGLSANSSFILRALLPLGALPILVYALMVAIFSGSSRNLIEICSLDDTASWVKVGVYIATVAYLGWSFLTLGTSIIAPAAENHSTRRRILILAIAIIAVLIFVITGGEADYLPWLFTVIGLPAIATALTERSFNVDSVRAPFLKYGGLGKIASWFLSPGWPSGVFFTLILSAIFVLGRVFHGTSPTDSEVDVGLAGVVGTFLFPAVLLILFRTDEAARVANYLLIMIASGVFTMVMYAMSQALSKDDLLWFFVWNPLTFLPLAGENSSARDFILLIAIGVAVFYSIVLIFLALSTWARQRKA